MVNPYRSTVDASSQSQYARGVRRYLLLSMLSLMCAALASAPAAVLLNQEWQVVPTNAYTTDIEFNGTPISNRAAINYSLTIGSGLLSAGIIAAVVAIRNWRLNRKIKHSSIR